jgi:hypothetical protein
MTSNKQKDSNVTGLVVTPDDGLLWLKHVVVKVQ